ncbi:MAG TPA: polysaccharide pyruvyl transferase CsaB [bacterium]|nr:polysaccharide pyruvyl transferase CsaB [bacterium]
MNIFIIGYFGSGNVGDEAILGSFLSWSRKRLPGAGHTALTSRPEETSARHDVGTVTKGDFAGLARALRRADAVVLPGGGLLQDATSARSAVYYCLLIIAAGAMGKPVYMMSQGMGPFRRKWTRGLAGWAMRRFVRRAWARDERALGLMREMGLGADVAELGADMTFAAGAGSREAAAVAADASMRLAVSLRQSEGVDVLTGALVGCLMRLKETAAVAVDAMAFEAEADAPVVERFVSEMRRLCPGIEIRAHGVDGRMSAERAAEVVGGARAMIGMRLHSLAFAAARGVPFVALSYDPKVKAFADACGQPVFEKLEEVSAFELSRAVEFVAGGGAAEAREKLAGAAASFSALAERSLSVLERDLLEAEGRTLDVLGVPVVAMSLNRTVEKIRRAALNRERLHIITFNPEMAMLARRDAEFAALARSGTLNTADGVGIRIALRLKHGARAEAVTGIDLAEKIFEMSAAEKLRVYLLGAKPETIEKCAAELSARKPPPLLAGYHHGYIRDADPVALAEEIEAARPDIVLAGMGAPMQEFWIRDNAPKLSASVFIGVGGSFDVFAGETKRAPAFFRKTGLEWAHRLATAPSRAKRMTALPAFLAAAVWDAFKYRIRKEEQRKA